MKPKGLGPLIQPKTLAEFFTHFETNRAFVAHGRETTLRHFAGLPFLASLDALLTQWPESVQVHLPNIADEASSIECSSANARKLFENGMGLMFDHAHKMSPELCEWLAAIRADLGLSALTYSRCLLYATPAGKGTAPHFDQNVNFVLQIHGTKKWWLAPNRHVENPLTRHTMGLDIDPEMQTYAEGEMPTEMPSDKELVTLEPGSLLFVPRGVWHTTYAESDALSLNFTFTAPTWLDLLSAALRSRLALSPEWRATANPRSEATFDSLLAALAYDLPNWNASEILSATEG